MIVNDETNGIFAGDGYVLDRIYFEAKLDNIFFRKESDFESYESNRGFNKKIESITFLFSPSAIKTLFANLKNLNSKSSSTKMLLTLYFAHKFQHS